MLFLSPTGTVHKAVPWRDTWWASAACGTWIRSGGGRLVEVPENLRWTGWRVCWKCWPDGGHVRLGRD